MTNLRAGVIELSYLEGALRYIKFGGQEVIRMIYFALRDENWGTVPFTVTSVEKLVLNNSFHIKFTCLHERNQKQVFQWKGDIAGSNLGQITFEITGTALETIKKNRAGFCVLHPTSNYQGIPVTIRHPDMRSTDAHFPTHIAPVNPFQQVCRMDWKLHEQSYTLLLDGEAFETEDQRNWGDASFKTFCTPLNIPFPVTLEKGQQIYQRIEFSANLGSNPVALPQNAEIGISSTIKPFPHLGTLLGSSPLHEVDIALLNELKFGHMQIEIHAFRGGWENHLLSAAAVCQKVHSSIAASIYLSDRYKEELAQVAAICRKHRVHFTHLTLLSENSLVTDPALLDHFSHMDSSFADSIGYGTPYNFTELNRERHAHQQFNFVSCAVHPQEHAFDDLTLIENVQAHKDIVTSARASYPHKKIHLAPVTLTKRYNPYATDPARRNRTEEQQLDERLHTAFGACWSLGSIKHISEAGAEAVTYYRAKGSLGILTHHSKTTPVYHALQKLAGTRSSGLYSSVSSHPLLFDGIFFDNGAGLLFNYTPEKQSFKINDESITLLPLEVRAVRF